MSKKTEAKSVKEEFKTSVVKHLPPTERKSKYDALFEKVPDEGLLSVEFDEISKARNARGSLRGYLKSRGLTDEYKLDRRGKVVYISKASYVTVYPDPTKEDEAK